VAKLARVGDGGIPAEHDALRRLRTWGIEHTPFPIGLTTVDGAIAGIESELDGRVLRAWVQERARSGSRWTPLETISEWLDRLHRASARPMTDEEAVTLIDVPLRAAGIGDLSGEEIVGLQRLRQAARSLRQAAPLPVVFVHGDLGTTNVLVDQAGRLSGVVDWETARWGLPLTDLLYLVDAVGADQNPSAATVHRNDLQNAVVGAAIEGSRRHSGMVADWIPIVRAAMLAGHASREAASAAARGVVRLPFRSRLRAALLDDPGSGTAYAS
jgi:aminoglycoside phosphotransferase (APT) family kinase protein